MKSLTPRVFLAVLVLACVAFADYGDECEANSLHLDCGRKLGCNLNETCSCCSEDRDCQLNRLSSENSSGHFHRCENVDPFDIDGMQCSTRCEHKDLFPYIHWDAICMVVVAICTMIAASAGIGGGGMIVPALIFLANFPADYASPLSSVTITGGAVANFIAYARKRHPHFPKVKKPLIEYDVSLLIMPALLAGTNIGTVLVKILPLWLITVLLLILLFVLSVRTSFKARDSYLAEKERNAKKAAEEEEMKDVATTEPASPPSPVSPVDPSEDDLKDHVQFPKWPILLTVCAWICIAVFAFLKGGKGFDSIIPGVECGNAGYWVITVLSIAVMLCLTVAVRRRVLQDLEKKEEETANRGEDGETTTDLSEEKEKKALEEDLSEEKEKKALEEETQVKWNSKNTVVFPVICFVCGIAAGMLGIGGGMVVGPLLVELGLHPRVVAATSAYAVLVSASAASFQFLVMGSLLPMYSLFYLLLGFFATVLGQRLMDAVIKKMNMTSAIVIVIAGVTILATVAMGYRSVSELVLSLDRNAHMGFRNLCD